MRRVVSGLGHGCRLDVAETCWAGVQTDPLGCPASAGRDPVGGLGWACPGHGPGLVGDSDARGQALECQDYVARGRGNCHVAAWLSG